MNVLFFVALFFSVTIHEVTHGFVALQFGDTTARDAHRLTLNPFRHIDPVGTLLLPLSLLLLGLPPFGWAKPVPVNVQRLREPSWQWPVVSLSGPAMNVVLSFVGWVVAEVSLHAVHSAFMLNIGVAFGLVNVVLGLFNLLPIPPLDGSVLLEKCLPRFLRERYYRLRSFALPITMALVLLDSQTTHFLDRFLADAQNFWLSLLF